MENYAGVKDCNDGIQKELEEVEINVNKFSFVLDGEVPTKILGSLGPWSFKRAWYYWVAEGPGIPLEEAEELHKNFGQEVRVAGHCGCPSPREWYKGFCPTLYHIDSQKGLNALAKVIKDVMGKIINVGITN